MIKAPGANTNTNMPSVPSGKIPRLRPKTIPAPNISLTAPKIVNAKAYPNHQSLMIIQCFLKQMPQHVPKQHS